MIKFTDWLLQEAIGVPFQGHFTPGRPVLYIDNPKKPDKPFKLTLTGPQQDELDAFLSTWTTGVTPFPAIEPGTGQGPWAGVTRKTDYPR